MELRKFVDIMRTGSQGIGILNFRSFGTFSGRRWLTHSSFRGFSSVGFAGRGNLVPVFRANVVVEEFLFVCPVEKSFWTIFGAILDFFLGETNADPFAVPAD